MCSILIHFGHLDTQINPGYLGHLAAKSETSVPKASMEST